MCAHGGAGHGEAGLGGAGGAGGVKHGGAGATGHGGTGGAGHGGVGYGEAGEAENFVTQQQFNAFQINIQNQLNQFRQQILQIFDNIQIRLRAIDGQ